MLKEPHNFLCPSQYWKTNFPEAINVPRRTVADYIPLEVQNCCVAEVIDKSIDLTVHFRHW